MCYINVLNEMKKKCTKWNKRSGQYTFTKENHTTTRRCAIIASFKWRKHAAATVEKTTSPQSTITATCGKGFDTPICIAIPVHLDI